jgi:hypothetical protein
VPGRRKVVTKYAGALHAMSILSLYSRVDRGLDEEQTTTTIIIIIIIIMLYMNGTPR